ncbi:hypothetical protein N7456_013180 [Penicillium angulare]|uniref:AB hydrolase-1 domain-containing protein n=1 Tax=Penicillium angulare TaxID=116970 RepID=A0A9W9EL03_9EURO|nr:hypothetical protein N7456_013180 [Penicillium angulare]
MPGICILQDPSRRPELEQTVTLADGRSLGYAEFGSFDVDAIPLFFLHGRPGSRLHAAWFDEAAYDMNVRIIAVDRPGFGTSTQKYNRKVLDWPADLSEMAKLLGIEQYYIIGYSAGGPYALACAHALPKSELLGVGILAGMGPYESAIAGKTWSQRMIYNFSYYMPRLAQRFVHQGFIDFEEGKDQDKMIDTFMKNIPLADQEFLCGSPEIAPIFPISVQQTFSQGFETYIIEKAMLSSDWGFQLEDIQDQNVVLWNGTEDKNVPLLMGHYLNERIPNSELKIYEGDTHYTINMHAEEILCDLLTIA